MDVRQLKTFVHVAELGSISAAADSLNTAQPAVSRVIRGLEADLGTRLFERHGRGVSLTPDGETLLASATRILREVEQARAELVGADADPTGQVAIALPPTVAAVLAGPLVARFTAHYPRVQLRIFAGSSGYVRDWLLDGTVDFAVTYQSRHLRSMSTEALLTERLWAIAAPGVHAPGATLPFRALAERPLALAGPEHGLRILLDGIAEQQGLRLAALVETDNLQIQIELAERGVATSVMPIAAARGPVSAARIVEPEVTRRLHIVTTRQRSTTPAAARLRAILADEVKRLVQSGAWDAELA